MADRHRAQAGAQAGAEAGAEAARFDPRGAPFLGTRFVPPERPTTFLRRARLVARLDRAPDTPLTLVDGPAGAGKTLLVADWAAQLGRPVAWLTADSADQAPGVFWAYVVQALRAGGVPLPPDVGCPAHASRVDRALLARLAAGLSDRTAPALLVLDEFDHVPSLEIAEQLEFVLHHAGPGLRLVLVTRSEPLLPLHRYRVAGSITEIRGAELAFTPEEAAAVLDTHGLRLTEDAVRGLVRRTGGWAAGLRLCALAAQQSPDPERYLKEFEAGRSTVADFLLAEVLKRQPPATQDLLLKISVVERFRAGLADALTGRTDAESVLARLRRENAFVEPLGHDWYRLHPLFAEILRAHLRERQPGLETRLHRRAARWLSRWGSLGETLAHGSAAGDWEFTSRALVDDLAVGQLFSGLYADDLADLFSRMTAGAGGPAVHLVLAARALAGHDLDRGLTHLRHAERDLCTVPADPPDATRAPDPPDAVLPPGMSLTRAAADSDDDWCALAPARMSVALLEALVGRLTGSPARAERAADAARELRRALPADLLERHPELTAQLLTHLGVTRLWAGRFDEARAALSEAAACTGGVATASARQESLAHLALIDYLEGRFGGAEKRAQAATREADRYGLPPSSRSGIGRLVLAAVAVERDELDEAQALLGQVAEAHGGPQDPVLAALGAITGARLRLARGQARTVVEAGEPAVTAEVSSPWAETEAALVAAAALIAVGRAEEAAELLGPTAEHRPACAVAAARAELAADAGATGTFAAAAAATGTTGAVEATGTTGTTRATAAAETAETTEAWPTAEDSGTGEDLRAAEDSGIKEDSPAAADLRAAEDSPAAEDSEAGAAAQGAGGDAPAPDFLDRLPTRTGGPALTVRATLVRAQAADRAGDAAAAQRLVGEALREARRECLRRPFIEAGPWIRPLLGTPANRELGRGWLTVRQGPHAAPARHAARVHAGAGQGAPVVERLSARERDVLQRLAQVMSTEEIAADLYLSVNTVKTHLKNVYRKLSVNRRGDALRRARELGML
ncbi:LuxR C-terminal-related transcriptional regulator [Streptomyces sp. NPDC059378]|uniref:LuxR C-terminal-related transcriptional regulator n=1 Tax=Streptomyces sp. NPDC059378 TaxID=3346815 RepID=UPI00369D273B